MHFIREIIMMWLAFGLYCWLRVHFHVRHNNIWYWLVWTPAVIVAGPLLLTSTLIPKPVWDRLMQGLKLRRWR